MTTKSTYGRAGRKVMDMEQFFFDGRDPYEMERRWRESQKWVDPRRTREKSSHPYSYDEFYIWRDRDLTGSGADYSDRLAQWDYEKFRRCTAPFKKRFDHFSRADCARFLSDYFGRPIVATALVEGCNASSGYPYWIFFHKDAPASSAPSSRGGKEG